MVPTSLHLLEQGRLPAVETLEIPVAGAGAVEEAAEDLAAIRQNSLPSSLPSLWLVCMQCLA